MYGSIVSYVAFDTLNAELVIRLVLSYNRLFMFATQLFLVSFVF